MAGVVNALASSGRAERLAGVAGGDEFDGINGRPVLRLDVGQDRNTRPMASEHSRRVLVGLAEPRRARVERRFDGQVQPTDAAAQRAVSHTRDSSIGMIRAGGPFISTDLATRASRRARFSALIRSYQASS